jgi:hypothetical protein
MNSHRISLALATVFTILSGTVLPSTAQADRSCPLGYTDGVAGCQKVLKERIFHDCNYLGGYLAIHIGRDICEAFPGEGFHRNSQDNVYSEANPRKKSAVIAKLTKLTKEIDPGFGSPGTPSRQRKVLTSENVVFDDDSTRKQDYTDIVFTVVIIPNSPL